MARAGRAGARLPYPLHTEIEPLPGLRQQIERSRGRPDP